MTQPHHSIPPPDAPNDQPSDAPVLPPTDAEVNEPLAPRQAVPARTQQRRAQVHVAPNLLDLVSVADTPEQASARQQQHDLNQVVHRVLVVGLIISTVFMLIGVGLALFLQRDLPQAVPQLGDVWQRVLALRPSGFLALGLLVLIATPILRVIGSIAAFVYERDWRYAAITALVFAVMITSILLGHG